MGLRQRNTSKQSVRLGTLDLDKEYREIVGPVLTAEELKGLKEYVKREEN